MGIDPEMVTITEEIDGSDIPVELIYLETWDGLYTPIGLRLPHGAGPFPVVLLASGNGGGGMAWIRDAVANRGYIMERLLAARLRVRLDPLSHRGRARLRERRPPRP